jgi:sugar/nucleoside kinase (ribokinase family)
VKFMRNLLIVGGASLDTLHFAGRSAQTAGGAGMYTAAAAHQMGAAVTMFAPRPDPVPESLQPLQERIDWIGPTVHPDDLPRFEIVHEKDGTTVMEKAFFGKEILMDTSSLPQDLSSFDIVHLTPTGSAQHQLEFLKACRSRGARCLSAGTYPCMAEDETEVMREVFAAADLFFMNEVEASYLFDSVEEAFTEPGKLLFITLGGQGVWVVQGMDRTHLSAIQVEAQDPTGAGDTFCGATLAGLTQGMHPVMAARKAVTLAAHMITRVGPTALWAKAPEERTDSRVRINGDQVARIADLVGSLTEVKPFDFVGPEFPPVGHPEVVDFFFASTLQQFGFWYASEGRYQAPMIAPIDGHEAKGSDYLWRAYLRKLDSDQSNFYTPQTQAHLSREDMIMLFGGDDGSDPMPALDLHLAQAHAYSRDMLALNLKPADIVEAANVAAHPRRTFLEKLDHIGGYKDDPLRKKSALLAMILAQRPEHFLHLRVEDTSPPIIDYHLMRSCLRIGLLDILDESLEGKLRDRKLVQADEEWAVRHAAYRAIMQVTEQSRKSMGAVDWFFFNARRRCPEMTEPECGLCPVDPVCARRKELFQPVFRTTFY